MVTIAVGALLGWAFSGVLIGWGIVTTAFGAIMLGASLGSRFMPRDTSDFSSSPTYSFGPISNTMSQLVPIPVIYGTCRVAGNIIYQAFADDKKELQDLYILIGEGPVTAIHSVLANDQDPAALEDCSVSKYLNTTTATRDARDPSGARPYPDDVALICLTLKAQEKLNGTPTVTSIVDGVKVWTPSGFTWSRNPVWIILDILCHPRYGLGYGAVTNGIYQHPDWDKIDYACAVASAAYCDGIVSYGTRFQLDFVLDTQRPIRDVLADFLASCRGYLVESDKLQICIDAPVSTYSREITPDNIVEGSFTFWQAADEDVCNRITIDWIDPNNSYERVTDVFQDSADIADRGVVEKAISLLPVTRSGQVGHMGYYLLKTSLMVRDFCSFGVGLKDCDIMPGEVLRVTFESFTGWNKKPFRVVSVKDSGQDVMTVTCSEYIRDVYDDSVLDITHHIDTSLTTNYKPDDVTEMAIAEQLETLQDGSYNLIAKISWTPPASYSSLELWYRYSSEVSWKPAGTLPRGSEEYYLPCTGNIGDTLYAKIYVVSRLGIRSDGQTVSKILRGDLTPPAAPTNLKGTGGFRCALLTWADPGDGDLDHIEIYRSTESNTDDMTKIGIAPRFAQEYADGNLYALQTAWYRLKAVDVAGNKSEYSDIISVTSEALKHEDIPEQSLTPSKFIPELERAIEEIKALSAASIINSVNEDENRDAAAKATQELKTRVVAGLEAEAEARTQLAAQVDNHAAAIVAEQAARAEADQAEAEARTQLAAQVDNHAAAIVAEQAARAEADQAEAEARTQLAAQVGNHAAAIVAEQAARAEADQAEAEARTQLAAQVGNHAAAIEENADAIVELDGKVEAQYYVLVTADGKIGGFILGTNGTTSEFSILADKFKIATADGSDTQIFTVDTDTGLVQILGSLIASDSITGDKINAKTRIQIGDSIILDGPNNAIQISDGAILLNGATGALTCLDPRNTTTGKKVVLSYGDIQFLRYNTSTGVYEEYQSVKGIASGSANSGEWVEIPGVWLEQPDILVGPKLVKSFEAANVGLDQFWHFGVKAISEITAGSGRWRAMFACELRLGSDINVIQLGNEVTSSIGSGASAAEYYSNVFTTPANAREIIVNGHVKTSDASGFTPPPDTISIVLQYKLTSASQYTNAQSIQLSFNTYKRPNHEDWPQAVKTWVLSALGLSSGTYHVRLKYSLARQADPMHHISTARLSADNMQVETLSTGNIRAGSVYWLALSQG